MSDKTKEDENKPQMLRIFFFLKQKLQSVDNKKIIVPAKKLTFFLKILSKLLNKRFDLKMKVRGKIFGLSLKISPHHFSN